MVVSLSGCDYPASFGLKLWESAACLMCVLSEWDKVRNDRQHVSVVRAGVSPIPIPPVCGVGGVGWGYEGDNNIFG